MHCIHLHTHTSFAQSPVVRHSPLNFSNHKWPTTYHFIKFTSHQNMFAKPFSHQSPHTHTHTPSQCNSQSVLFSCSLPPVWSDLISPAGVSFRPARLSRGPLPGYKRVSKWPLPLQDSTPFLLLSQRLCTTLHTSASSGCYLLFTHMPDCPLAPLGQVWQQ